MSQLNECRLKINANLEGLTSFYECEHPLNTLIEAPMHFNQTSCQHGYK